MAGSSCKVAIVLVAFAITIPCLEGGIGTMDEFLKERAMEAHEIALKSYVPDPTNVTSQHNNLHVKETTRKKPKKESNSTTTTRREMTEEKDKKKYKGPCLALNPIDRCWRCKKSWAKNRFKLASCVKGFGRRATGGSKGKIYTVSDPSDDDPVDPKEGTLRYGVLQKDPLWIIFSKSMIIKLNYELLISSDKTIDGRGHTVVIKGGAGLTMQFVNNIIIHGLKIHHIKSTPGGMIRDSWDHVGTRTRADGDAISIFGSSNIWIDHISLSECEDGLVDIIQGSTAITVSNCHMTKHNDVMLFGASDTFSGDKIMQVTVAFNHFGQGLIQRMPRCRWGFFHVLNNDYTHWIMYAIGGSSGPTILSQGNRFIAPDDDKAKEVTHRDYAEPPVWGKWQWRSENDVFMNGAKFIQSGKPLGKLPFNKGYLMKPRHGSQANRLTRFAGTLKCKVGNPC